MALAAWLGYKARDFSTPVSLAYRRVVDEYGHIVRRMPDLAGFLQHLGETLQSTLNPASVSVWLYRADDHSLILSRFESETTTTELIVLPVDLDPKSLQGIYQTVALPDSEVRQTLLDLGIQTVASMNVGGELLGLIGLGAHQFEQSQEVVRLLDLLAGQGALAIKNAYLITDLEKTLSKLRLAYQRTIDAQEEERRNLAAELHDDILGRLTTMALTLRNSRNHLTANPQQVKLWLEALEKETQEVNRRLREITQGIHPSVLTDLGLVSALRAYMDQLAKQPLPDSAPQAVVLTAEGFNGQRISNPKLERDLYCITRQALDNALAHACARQVMIHLQWRAETIKVTIQDTGKGMKAAPEVLMGQSGHLGLLTMNERVRAWGGLLTFETQPDSGTTVRARLPIDQPSCNPTYLEAFTQHLAKPIPQPATKH
jgi:signal transduction histidine kinase